MIPKPPGRTDIKPVRLTNHARARMEEFGLTYEKVVGMLLHSEEENPKMDEYKREKYGDYQDGIQYYRNGTYIFTVRHTEDFKNGKEITLVITLTDQRLPAGLTK